MKPGGKLNTWADKFAMGKSVVRKMLEHLRAYGIDPNALGQRD
jgi:hypothetical protein